MRYIALLSALTVSAAGLAAADVPSFSVENKVTPRFRVENTLPKGPALPTDPNVMAPPGYQWQKVGDGPWKLVKLPDPAVSGVTPFPSGSRHDGHSCPSCGRAQYVVSGFNADGTHSHTCPSCGRVWKH
jgi:predicted RNA-binding Zn-ribbon protein involved in translation (DUF1610 family)